jgi:hypothetical protein
MFRQKWDPFVWRYGAFNRAQSRLRELQRAPYRQSSPESQGLQHAEGDVDSEPD